MERNGKKWILFSAMAIISCVLFVIMFIGKPYAEHVVKDTFVCNIFAWLGTLGVLSFMKKWGNFENTFTAWMKKRSYGLYVFHYLPLSVSGWYLKMYLPNMLPVFIYLLVAIAAFAGAFILDSVISKIPVIRWCVLGIRKETK